MIEMLWAFLNLFALRATYTLFQGKRDPSPLFARHGQVESAKLQNPQDDKVQRLQRAIAPNDPRVPMADWAGLVESKCVRDID
jgi:hypothetical protein